MDDSDALRWDRLRHLTLLQLKSWAPNAASAISWIPDPAGDWRTLKWAPGEWLLVGGARATPLSREEVIQQARKQDIAVVDVSQGLALFCLEGSAAREALTMACGLDLDPHAFPVGTCTRTRFAQLPVVIDYVDPAPRYELYLELSYVPYLLAWLEDVAVGL